MAPERSLRSGSRVRRLEVGDQANAVRAHRRLAEGHVLGKIVLRVAEN